MQHANILDALQTFALAHQLPAPVVQHQPDGQHSFLYTHDHSRRYAYTLLRDLLNQPRCFGLTQAGQPRHPLYVRTGTPHVAWQGVPPRASTT